MKAVELTISQKGCWPRSRNFAHCATYQWLDAARLRCNRLGGSQSQSNVSVTMVELPAPTGPFSIGAKIYNWVDRSRRELASKNPADSRQLIVQVWYPTEDRSGPASPYVPMLSSYRHIWEDSDVDVASRTLTHFRDAKPMSSVQFPVVLLSHGWQGTRSP